MTYESLRRRKRGTYGASQFSLVSMRKGDHHDFLARFEQRAQEMTASSSPITALEEPLLNLIADQRNLMCAIDHIVADGPKAVGPNGLALDDLTTHERWGLARSLKDALLTGAYHPGRTSTRPVAKSSGGYRVIEIHNAEDSVVQRGITQILQPLLDPRFDDFSMGYRPGRGREVALATAELIIRSGRTVLITEDLRDAFTTVPVGRLIGVLEYHRLPADVIELIRLTLSNRASGGLPQGAAHAPLHLNMYLDHYLDRLWRAQRPNIPFIRVADDLLFFCQSRAEAEEAYALLDRLIRPTGMRLKGRPETAIRDLGDGDSAYWLGLRLRLAGGDLHVQLGDRNCQKLVANLEECHIKPNSTLRALESVFGWLYQQGACAASLEPREVYRRIRRELDALQFTEGFSLAKVEAALHAAAVRDTATRRVVFLDFARRDRSRPRRPVGVRSDQTEETSSSLPPGQPVTICTDGAYDHGTRVGAWAFSVSCPGSVSFYDGSESYPQTTVNRMELMAVLRALRTLRHPSNVTLITDSEYIFRGITERLPTWKSNGWRRRDGRQPRHLRLWIRVDEEVSKHRVECQWVRGHSGHPGNDHVDALACRALQAELQHR